MNADKVIEYIKSMNDLSTIPTLMAKIVRVLNDTESEGRELLKLISHDHSLAEKVVRVANSSFFGHSGEVRDINQAIMLLGYDRIKSISLGMTVLEIFPTNKSYNLLNLWSHSYEIALFSQAFSELICMTCPRECFLVGLLHDIGRIIFLKMDKQKFLDIDPKQMVSTKEVEFFGCTHADAGAWFAEMNNMPAEIVSAIKFHHEPSKAKEYKDIVSIISLAEAISHRYSRNKANDGIWKEEHDILMMEYELTDDDILFVGDRYCAARPDIENFFSTS